MFEYLASKKIIFASYNNAYKHIPKNNYNSILITPEKKNKWIRVIKKVITNKKKYSFLKTNASLTAKNILGKKDQKKFNFTDIDKNDDCYDFNNKSLQLGKNMS